MSWEGDDRQASDLKLASSCADGQPAACESFERQFHEILHNVLLSRGATATEAQDLTRSLLSDCVMGQPGHQPLLRLYHGRCLLRNWLITCATHRLIDLKRSEKFKGDLLVDKDEPNNDDFDALAAPGCRSSEPALLDLLRGALEYALAACGVEERLMLRIVYLDGVTQREVARMWCCHESNVSRRMEDAMQTIAECTMLQVRQKDPWLELTWEDFLQMCEASQTPLPL